MVDGWSHESDRVAKNIYKKTKLLGKNFSINKIIIFVILAIGIASVSAFTLMPTSLSAECVPTFWKVSASEAPQYDKNHNGFICKYVRDGSPPITIYQDD